MRFLSLGKTLSNISPKFDSEGNPAVHTKGRQKTERKATAEPLQDVNPGGKVNGKATSASSNIEFPTGGDDQPEGPTFQFDSNPPASGEEDDDDDLLGSSEFYSWDKVQVKRAKYQGRRRR